MTSCVELLRDAFARSSEALGRVLNGIGDEEFFWEPVADCWTVHHRSEVRATSADGCGEWVIDYDVRDPDPAPVTTIAWRTVHIAAVNYLYWDYAFGPATASFDLEMPGNAATAADWLKASQEPLRTVLAGLADADLEIPRKTNWGELWPSHRIFSTVINEQAHHGAEISLLRTCTATASRWGASGAACPGRRPRKVSARSPRAIKGLSFINALVRSSG